MLNSSVFIVFSLKPWFVIPYSFSGSCFEEAFFDLSPHGLPVSVSVRVAHVSRWQYTLNRFQSLTHHQWASLCMVCLVSGRYCYCADKVARCQVFLRDTLIPIATHSDILVFKPPFVMFFFISFWLFLLFLGGRLECLLFKSPIKFVFSSMCVMFCVHFKGSFVPV